MTFRNILGYFVWRSPAEAYTNFITLHKILSSMYEPFPVHLSELHLF